MPQLRFTQLSGKHKRQWVMSQLFVFILIIGALMLSAHITKVELPTKTEKVTVPLGFGLLGLVTALAFLNRLKTLFRIKSLGFGFMAIILYFLNTVIDTLVVGVSLMFVALLVGDIINKIWSDIWWRDYER